MMIQQISDFHLKRLHLYVTNTFYDCTNAFYSLIHSQVERAVQPPVVAGPPEDYFIRQRIRLSTMIVGDHDGDDSVVLAREGVLPGEHAGPRLFNRTMALAGDTIVYRVLAEVPLAKQLVVFSPLQDRKFFVGLTGFVDDLANEAVAATSAEEQQWGGRVSKLSPVRRSRGRLPRMQWHPSESL